MYLDEGFGKINGEPFYIWRAIDHESVVLESFAFKRRDRNAVLKMLKKLTSNYCSPTEVVTDKVSAHSAALRSLGIPKRHEARQYQNNIVEISHRYFRRREHAVCWFR